MVADDKRVVLRLHESKRLKRPEVAVSLRSANAGGGVPGNGRGIDPVNGPRRCHQVGKQVELQVFRLGSLNTP